MRRAIVSATILIALSGCTSNSVEEAFQRDLSAELPKTGVEERALVGNLYQAYTAACPVEAQRDAKKVAGAAKDAKKNTAARQATKSVAMAITPESACLMRTDLRQPDVRNYLDAGFTLSDYLCETFFRHLNKSSRMRHRLRGTTGNVGTVMGTVLSLTHAGSIATGVSTGLFGAADREFQNFEDSYTVAPDLSNLRHLVVAAQDNMRKKSFEKKDPMSLFGAETTILRHASLCSYLGMQELLNASVRAKSDEIDAANQGVSGGTDTGKPPKAPAAAKDKPAKGKRKPGRAAPPKLPEDIKALSDELVAPPPPTTRALEPEHSD